MCVNVLPDHIPIHQMHAVSVEAKVEFQTLMSSHWVLGFEVGPLEEEPVLLTADLTIYSQRHSF